MYMKNLEFFRAFKLSKGINMDSNVIYAGFWRRVLATVIDWVWLYGTVYFILWLVQGDDFMSLSADYTVTQFILEWVVPFVVVLTFWIITAATPGKMLLKIKIVDSENHEAVPAPRLLLRYVGYFISIIPIFLGMLWVGWDSKKQGWHDKIAKTVLIVS